MISHQGLPFHDGHHTMLRSVVSASQSIACRCSLKMLADGTYNNDIAKFIGSELSQGSALSEVLTILGWFRRSSEHE